MLPNVNTSLSGYVQVHNGLRLILDRNCIVRSAACGSSEKKVMLLSGGGSGHEPAHVGYVGYGMLDGAVCGDVFCSPSATAIVDCLQSIATPNDEVLFIVNNYTGDRLNFGLAAERAAVFYGFKKVMILLNDDDCSIEEGLVRRSVGKRGLAGSVLLIKILGAMAESGHTIEEIYRLGNEILREGHLATFGFTFDIVNEKLVNVELGKGLHGEPGVYKLQTCDNFEPIIEFMIDKLSKKIKTSSIVVVLINNLGGTSEFMLGVFMAILFKKLQKSYAVHRIYSGTFFSSLGTTGLSVTLLNLGYSDKLLSYLDFEVQHIAHALLTNRDLLNTYDRECGDGDTGNTIAKGAQAILDHLESATIEILYPAKLLLDLSMIMQLNVGGTSGALYSLLLQTASTVFVEADRDSKVTIKHWIQALSRGNEAIKRYALAELGDRTMLDPLGQAELELKRVYSASLSTIEYIRIFSETCQRVAEDTRRMVPKSGRASYSAVESGQADYKCPDPGAFAISVWARALLEACKVAKMDQE
ncbi:triokinase/FMN cyclase-like [Sabethes cyaneus]|uniref:triokinase/FMN cyclase-like n=1 Tax=Sabethes cyaneus TaxID=53552 RepID=UPI00237E8CB3|nr:triokinase/FMN cyclase-like [Sabethes cyaneus]